MDIWNLGFLSLWGCLVKFPQWHFFFFIINTEDFVFTKTALVHPESFFFYRVVNYTRPSQTSIWHRNNPRTLKHLHRQGHIERRVPERLRHHCGPSLKRNKQTASILTACHDNYSGMGGRYRLNVCPSCACKYTQRRTIYVYVIVIHWLSIYGIHLGCWEITSWAKWPPPYIP